MSNEKTKTAQNLAAQAILHTHAIHTMLDGLELLADARLIAAAYIARAGIIHDETGKHETLPPGTKTH